MRHAYVVLKSRFVDVLAGQTFDLFGWQNYYLAFSLLGLPNQLSSRNVQFRLSRTFGAAGPVSVDVAVAAVRPAQRDSQVPDIQGGVRFSLNGWKGITTPGNASTVAAPLSLGISGIVRQFKVNAFTPPPAQSSNNVMGWGGSFDLFVPVIPARNGNDRGNRLTLIGSFVIGTGIADLIAAGGGARFPTLPNPAQASPPPLYTADVDKGLVSFDTRGVLHTIDWWAAKGAFQYYLPGLGTARLAGNFTYAQSDNIAKLFPRGGAEIELLGASPTRRSPATATWSGTRPRRFASASRASTPRSSTSTATSPTTSAASAKPSTSSRPHQGYFRVRPTGGRAPRLGRTEVTSGCGRPGARLSLGRTGSQHRGYCGWGPLQGEAHKAPARAHNGPPGLPRAVNGLLVVSRSS